MNLGEHPCIISAGIGHWYPHGIRRLEKSLLYEGWGGDTLTWTNYPEGCPSHHDNPYAFKIYAFREAFARGHKVVVWVDSSLWCVSNPMPLFDYVNEKGLWLFKSGYPISATATDRLLKYTDDIRENLVDVPEYATGCVGINIDNPDGKQFFEYWELMMEEGLFKGSRGYDPNDSTHPLFKFSRQDQSCASMVINQLGLGDFSDSPAWCVYKEKDMSRFADAIFFIGGL